MAGYRDRLKRLSSEYANTKPASGSGFKELPKGTYQFVISAVKLIQESKTEFAKGELEVQVYARVLTGEHKGSMGRLTFFLEQPAKKVNDKEIPSGLAQFKGLVDGLGISLPQLSEKALHAALRELKDMKFNGYCTGRYNTVYFNSALDTADMDVDDSEFEDALDEESDDTEEEVEEEEDPAPKPVRARKNTKGSKKAAPAASDSEGDSDVESEDEEFDFEEF